MNKEKKKLLKTMLLIFIVLLTIIPLHIKAEEIKTIKAKEIWTIENAGSYPCLSPDGSMIAWVKESKVFIAKVGTKERIELGKTEELLGWLPGSNEYLMTAEGFLSVKTKQLVFSIKNDMEKFVQKTTVSIPFGLNPDSMKILVPMWIIQNGKITKSYSTGGKYNFSLLENREQRKVIIFSNGISIWEKDEVLTVFSFIPFGNKLFIYSFPGANRPQVIDTKTNKTYNLPEGIDFSWSPDGQKLIFAVLEDDGHKLTSGELFICNWDGSEVRQIIFDTPRIRTNPSFGYQNLITYSIEENGTHGIGVAKINF